MESQSALSEDTASDHAPTPAPAPLPAPAPEEAFRNPVEGPAMLSIGVVGILLNLLCLCVLRRTRELKLSPDYLFLLRLQSGFDLLYLLTSTPVTSLPHLFPSLRDDLVPLTLPYVFPFVQISMVASIYTTIALAFERYLSIRDASTVARSFPCCAATGAIVLFSVAINAPRFFELRAVRNEGYTLQVTAHNLLHCRLGKVSQFGGSATTLFFTFFGKASQSSAHGLVKSCPIFRKDKGAADPARLPRGGSNF